MKKAYAKHISSMRSRSGSFLRGRPDKKRTLSLLPFDFCLLAFDFPACFLLTGFCLVPSVGVFAQKPYAVINHNAVDYRGPGRDAGHDLAGPEIRIGLLAPLTGPRQAEGLALRNAAQMAMEDENAASLPGNHHLALVTGDENGRWGQAAAEIVHMVFDDDVVALITSAEGRSAHLAEQVAIKVGVPVLTPATDATTTEINLPWIFRLGPSDADQAQAFARDIYQMRQLHRVLLLTQNDHDGRAGGDEFEKAARHLEAPKPVHLTVESDKPSLARPAADLDNIQAVVIWSDGATAVQLVADVQAVLPAAPIYLCTKAVIGDPNSVILSEAKDRGSGPSFVQTSNLRSSLLSLPGQNDISDPAQPWCRACPQEDSQFWTATTPASHNAARESFERRYHQCFGTEPSLGAAEAYDALHVLAASLHRSGPNRARLRDSLAQVSNFAGISGIISFDHAGNDTSRVTLLRLHL